MVLTQREIFRILSCVKTFHSHVFLSLVYACGLRLGEALALTIDDIDARPMLVHVRAGKGRKDRTVPRPEDTLKLLRRYWRTHRHPTLLFPALGRGGKSGRAACQSTPFATVTRRICWRWDSTTVSFSGPSATEGSKRRCATCISPARARPTPIVLPAVRQFPLAIARSLPPSPTVAPRRSARSPAPAMSAGGYSTSTAPAAIVTARFAGKRKATSGSPSNSTGSFRYRNS